MKKFFFCILFLVIFFGCESEKGKEINCVEKSHKEIKRAIDQLNKNGFDSVEGVKTSISALIETLDGVNLDNCPSDYKFQALKIKNQFVLLMSILNKGVRDKETSKKIVELSERGKKAGYKLDEIAASYGLKFE
ncbi:hypothetical protein C8N46_101306 [Kordia periserrulae]|uniref:Lipoprotein n=1 Tax=Kordia periserrulae TaxID=701523 RepID=A0A2T6C5X5_9FLAO|nr:hypothetical protein [Kordia periserrulae]PTX63702.1 hypothetical protein C8N46_101306 [Kordia periserrulae]